MKVRELSTLCLAPIALVGYLTASEVTTKVSDRTQHTTGEGALLELMTCDRGWGAGLKASTNGLYAIDAHYGVKGTAGPWSISLLPKGGISVTDHTVKELPQTVQFSVGAQLLAGYESFLVGAELWHLSNAGLTAPNIGLNMVAVQIGWRF